MREDLSNRGLNEGQPRAERAERWAKRAMAWKIK